MKKIVTTELENGLSVQAYIKKTDGEEFLAYQFLKDGVLIDVEHQINLNQVSLLNCLIDLIKLEYGTPL